MHMRSIKMIVPLCAIFSLALPVSGEEVMVVEFPDPALFYGNASFAIDGDVAYVPTYDNDMLWSFSLQTGALLDPDGLALPAPGLATNPFIFMNHRVVIPGWFPNQGLFVADVSDPANLAQAGIIQLPPETAIQGQNVEVDENGYIGYVAGFPNDTLYSFNVNTLSLEDPDGLALPGNPDRIALTGTRLAMVDTNNGCIMVADASDPANLQLAGTITLPGAPTFGSNNNIVFAADGRTGFVTTLHCILYSFDVLTLALLDPDGVSIGGSQYIAGDVAIHGDTVACLYSRGLTFVDVSNPSSLSVISQADFGGTVSPSIAGTVEFTADGTMAAVPVVWPSSSLYTFEVATGNQVSDPLAVDPYAFFTTIFGPDDTVGMLLSNGDARIWLVSGLFTTFTPGDLNCDGGVDLSDVSPFVLALIDPRGYAGAYPLCDIALADINADREVNGMDIQLFVEILLRD